MAEKDTNKEKIRLLDLIGETILEHLLSGFCEKFNSRMQIFYRDSNDNLKNIKVNHKQAERLRSNICKTFRDGCKTCQDKCEDSNFKAAERLFNSENPKKEHYRCESLGLINMIAPIKVRNEVIGAIIFGQEILENEVTSILEKICKDYPESKPKFELAFQEEQEKHNNNDKSTICSSSDIDDLLKELQDFADMISDICEKVKKLEDEKKQRGLLLSRIRHEIPKEVNLIQTAAKEIKEYFSEKYHKAIQDNNAELTKIRKLLSIVNHLALSDTRIELFADFATAVNFTKEEILDKRKTLNLITYINSMKDVFRTEARDKGVDIKFYEPREPYPMTIRSVSRFYELAICNIIFNAIRYSRFGTCVEVVLNKPWVIEIVNYGIATKEEDKEKIYEEGYRGSEAISFARDGLGFGLYLARKVINAHDGHSLTHLPSIKLSNSNCAGIDSFYDCFDNIPNGGWEILNKFIKDTDLKVPFYDYKNFREKMKSISRQSNYDYKTIDTDIVYDFVKSEFDNKKQIDFDEFQRLYLKCDVYKTVFTIKYI